MTEPSVERNRKACAEVMLLFEKTLVEEVLSVGERQVMDSHLARCARCRNLVKLTSGLSLFVEETDRDRIDDAVRSVSRALRYERQAAQGLKGRWKTVLTAGAAAACLLIAGAVVRLWVLDSPRSSAPSSCLASLPKEPVSGVFVTYCEGAEPRVVRSDNGLRVSLSEGAVGLFVDPKRPNKRKVVVETPRGEVRVKGTLFTVQVDRDDARVDVYRGVVEVAPKQDDDNEAFQVAAGFSAKLGKRATHALHNADEDTLQKALRSVAASDSPDKTKTEGEGNETPTMEEPARSLGETSHEADSREEPAASLAENPRRDADRGPKRTPASMDALLHDAQSCLLIHDWECAASKYQELLRLYSGRPESAAVLISLAKIELRHLNLPGDALDHYQTYERRSPNGPLLEEALLGKADVYRRLGQKQSEVDTLRVYLDRFPGSSLSGKARARLKQLSDLSSL